MTTDKPITWPQVAATAIGCTFVLIGGSMVWGWTHPEPSPEPEPPGCRETSSSTFSIECKPGQTFAVEQWGEYHVGVCRCPKDGGAP
jgi:hypothetical protein